MEDDGLGELFWAVARRMRHATRDALAPWDVTPSQARALGVLTRHGPQRLTVLAEHLGIAARSATEVVDLLQQRGLVERRPDPADRRATRVTPTAEGAAAGEAIRAARVAVADRMFAELGAADRADLGRILRRLSG